MRVPELDGLRGIAILGVLAFHLMPANVPRFASYFMAAGWLGVDLFFVLSGYLITGILVDTAGKEGWYRTFLLRRTLRIFPLYFVTLAFSTLVDLWPGPFTWQRFVDTGFWWYTCFLGNVPVFLQNRWLGSAAPYWSLQIEEQFYLTFPLLVWALPRKALARTLAGAIILAPLVRLALVLLRPANITGTYVLTPGRMDSLAMGGLIAILYRERPAALQARWIPAVTAFAALIVVWICYEHDPNPWSTAMRTVGFSAADVAFAGILILIVARRSQFISAICRLKPLIWLGTISYGVYLFHAAISEVIKRWMTGAGLSHDGWLAALLCLIASLAAATASWIWFESPILKLRNR